MQSTETLYNDTRRAMEICNACRYCEGYCAVFPALELRRTFSDADLDYLANLCHNCGSCYYACQYAPPHEFAINLPKSFAEVRMESYKRYAWPNGLARAFHRNGTLLSLATAASIALLFFLATILIPPSVLYGRHVGEGAFYAVVPWGLMASVGSVTFLFALFALFVGVRKFWRSAGGHGLPDLRASRQALGDALVLRNLGGARADGCEEEDPSKPAARRHLHHAVFYGFLLCFAATSVATLYHHIGGIEAPYGYLSLPVQLGLWGGIGLMVGTSGLAWLKWTTDPGPRARTVLGSDFALLMILWLSAATGLLLLAFRETSAMGTLLIVHLGVILAFFLFLPYSKFVHGFYRFAALLRAAQERAR